MDSEPVVEEPQEEVTTLEKLLVIEPVVEEVTVEEPKATGVFYYLRGKGNKFAIVGPDGRVLSGFEYDEERAKDMALRFNRR